MNTSVILQNFEKLDSMNKNLYTRNIPSMNLQANFDPRPVTTKYNILPILDNRKESTVPIINQGGYDSQEVFYQGTTKPHYYGFATNVDKESTLRNQFFALQAGDQAKYVPPSTSDLYINTIDFQTVPDNLEKSMLFRQDEFADFNPNPSAMIGNSLFNNSTRVQLKNIK
tara:strand:+ start:1114 stop:1623 length:510 start_codon:yes stop_codon:yes gene_type:complete